MFRNRWYLSVLPLAIAGFLAPQFNHGQGAPSQELLHFVAEPLPAGSVAQGAPSFYGPENLYKYMDGAADVFVLYGVRTLLHLDARANAVDVSVDIFEMGTPDSAFGMYAAERSPDYRFIAIGAEGYQDAGILNFVQDRYYVKLAGFGDGADSVLETWARALSARVGTNPALPALLAHLPREHRKPHSEQYMPNAPLGHPFLGPAYVVAYTEDGRESKLFVTLANDEADAQQRLKLLGEHFAKTGQCKAAPDLGSGAIQVSNSFEGDAIALTQGRYLVLLLNPHTGSGELLRGAVNGLR